MTARLLLVLVFAWSQVLQGAMVVCQEADGATNFEFVGRACELVWLGGETASPALTAAVWSGARADDCDLCHDAPLRLEAERAVRGFGFAPSVAPAGVVSAPPCLAVAAVPVAVSPSPAPASLGDAARAAVGVVRLRC